MDKIKWFQESNRGPNKNNMSELNSLTSYHFIRLCDPNYFHEPTQSKYILKHYSYRVQKETQLCIIFGHIQFYSLF